MTHPAVQRPNHLWVVLRTCDRTSISSDRIVPKSNCVKSCLVSLLRSLQQSDMMPWTLKIIDDASSMQTRDFIEKTANAADITWLETRDDDHLNARQKSRFSVSKAYDYIYQCPRNDLVYIVEDDYLHYPNSINTMIQAWLFFSEWLPTRKIGIYPQDFPQLHASPRHEFNDTYVKPCHTMIGPDRFYRTTWYTQETFLLQAQTFHDHKPAFDSLLTIGQDLNQWEGNTISQVWQHPDVMMLMPMPTMAIHVSQRKDIPFYCDDFETLWRDNQTS